MFFVSLKIVAFEGIHSTNGTRPDKLSICVKDFLSWLDVFFLKKPVKILVF